MATGAIGTAYKAYETLHSLTDTDATKRKIIQAVAFIIVANALYNTAQAHVTQATVNLTAGAALWMNQDAFLHKALSENVQSFGVENERLTNLVGKLEEVGVNLEKLTEDERKLLKENMEHCNSIVVALIKTSAESSQKLDASVEKQISGFTQACSQLLGAIDHVTEVLQAVKSNSTKSALAALETNIRLLRKGIEKMIDTIKQITPNNNKVKFF